MGSISALQWMHYKNTTKKRFRLKTSRVAKLCCCTPIHRNHATEFLSIFQSAPKAGRSASTSFGRFISKAYEAFTPSRLNLWRTLCGLDCAFGFLYSGIMIHCLYNRNVIFRAWQTNISVISLRIWYGLQRIKTMA